MSNTKKKAKNRNICGMLIVPVGKRNQSDYKIKIELASKL